MQEAFRAVHAEAARRAGWTGAGVGVAVLDTGLFLHPDLRGRVNGFLDLVNGRTEPYDDNGHGTHVAGVIGGDGSLSGGRYQGIAPGCRLTAVKVLDAAGGGSLPHMLQGLAWILENHRRLGIRIVNISVGMPAEDQEDSPLVRQVNRLWDAGLVVAAAAGNNGPGRGTVTAPGVSRKVITVGSSDDSRPAEIGGRRLQGYSGRGPTGQCIMKPEVTAPGTDIVSCGAGLLRRRPFYTRKSGTSMSTPVVAGAIALLLEKYPWMTNVEVKLALRESCRRTGAPSFQEGWGMLDIRRLLEG